MLFAAPTAGFDEITLGAVFIGDTRAGGTAEMWQTVARDMAENAARIVVMVKDPLDSIAEPARRLHACTQRALRSLRTVQYPEVRLASEAYSRAMYVLVLGMASGFDGDAVTDAAADERRVPHPRWRRIASTAPQEFQGTVNLILPPVTIKYLVNFDGLEGRFLSVWLRGASRRSDHATERRQRRRIRRQDDEFLERLYMDRTQRMTGYPRVVDEEDV